jgi:uncharacterized protein (TIGR02594 family)
VPRIPDFHSRRSFAVGLAAATVLPVLRRWSTPAAAAEADEADLLAAMGAIGRGIIKPTPAAVLRAKEILASAPLGPCHPYTVAKWFLTLDADDITEAPSGPHRANAIIVEFFRQATDFPPGQLAGDETWWCAAFVNWCLMRAQQERTRSALSSSFRQWHNVGEPPRVGDIVVFVDVADSAHGHVGFFRGFDVDNKIMTLGGNQRESGRQRICVQPYPRADGRKRLLSFDRDPAWPSVQ